MHSAWTSTTPPPTTSSHTELEMIIDRPQTVKIEVMSSVSPPSSQICPVRHGSAPGLQRADPIDSHVRRTGTGTQDECLSAAALVHCLSAHKRPRHAERYAPVAQGIEHRPPEAGARVRISPGAPSEFGA